MPDNVIISEDYRSLTVPQEQLILGCVGDAWVRRVYFTAPRYCDSTDMSTYLFSVHFVNEAGEEGRYDVIDKSAGTDTITFSWLVGPTACAVLGKTRVSVIAEKLSGTEIQNRFVSETYLWTVKPSTIATSDTVTEYSDEVYAVIEQWQEDFDTFMNDAAADIAEAIAGVAEAVADAEAAAEYASAFTEAFMPAATVGASENLTARETSEQSFMFRASQAPDDTVAGIEVVKGNTVRWNQLNRKVWEAAQNVEGLTITNDGTSMNIVGTVGSGFTTGRFAIGEQLSLERDGRKYLFKVNKDIGHDIVLNGYQSARGRGGFIWSATASAPWGGAINAVAAPGDVFNVSGVKAMVFDLTTMFGAGNEPATVAEFEALFPESYYAYDAGSLLNVNMLGVEGVGKNLLDASQCEIKKYVAMASGATSTSNGWSASGYIEVQSGYSYIFSGVTNGWSGVAGTAFYDKNKAFISSVNSTTTVLNPPSGAKYMRISFSTEDVSTVQVELGTAATAYVPYVPPNTREIDVSEYFPGGMKSAGSVYDELTRVAAVNRVGVRAYQSGDESDATLTTDGTTTNYPLATPVVTPIDPPLNLTFKSYEGGTERVLVDTTQSAPQSAPPRLLMGYGDTARTIRDKALSVIAMVEKPKAKANHAANTYLILNGKLYKVTSAIAVGESITPGTNVTETTVMAELLARL